MHVIYPHPFEGRFPRFGTATLPGPVRTVLGVAGLISLLLPAPSARAATIRIEPGGGGDFATIAEGIAEASDGDTLLLAPGTYRESLLIDGKSLTVRGEAGSPATVLEGGFRDRILEVRLLDAPLILEDLTFRRGVSLGIEFPGNSGGAIAAFTAPLTLRRCVFRENVVQGLGGAVYCTVLAVPGIGSPSPRQSNRELVIEDCVFEFNEAGDEGGAVFCDNTGLELRGTRFTGNRAVGGGAVLLLSGRGRVTECRFEGNLARVDGGAIRHSGFGPLSVTTTRFEENHADRHGGGMSLEGVGRVTLGACVLRNLSAGGDGGAIRAVASPLVAERVLWQGCSARRGGAIHLQESALSTFERCTWLDQVAEEGPSARLQLASADFHRCLFGEGDASPVRCNAASPVTGSCNAGEHSVAGCVPLALVTEVASCPSAPDQLCAAPEVEGCGVAGHEDTECGDPGCSTAVVPITWGRVKRLHD